MSDEIGIAEDSPNRLFIPAMVVATAAVSVSTSILTLFVVDVASTFHVPVGVASQLATVNHAGVLVFGLLMSVLVVRFKHKSLMLAGVLVTIIAAIGNFYTPDLFIMQIFFVIEGIGTAIVGIMSSTLIGDLLPLKNRASAVSYVFATGWIMALISIPWSGFIANVAGWRFVFILQMLPLSIVGLMLAFFAIPSKSRETTVRVKRVLPIVSFRQILTDKSAVACLASGVLSISGPGMAIFGVAMYRQRFSMSLDFTVALSLAVVALHVVGNLVAGRLTNKFGAKPVAVACKLLAGVSTITFFLMPSLLGALVFNFLQVWFASLVSPAYTCLALSQVPKSRGSMMSLFTTARSLARTIATAVGGALLVFTFGFYGAVGLALGGMSLAAAIILFLFAKDPTRT